MTPPIYPEHDKLEAVAEKSHVIGEFLEYMNQEHGWVICAPEPPYGFFPVTETIPQKLAKYFGIDLVILETEKRAMLDAMRSLTDAEN